MDAARRAPAPRQRPGGDRGRGGLPLRRHALVRRMGTGAGREPRRRRPRAVQAGRPRPRPEALARGQGRGASRLQPLFRWPTLPPPDRREGARSVGREAPVSEALSEGERFSIWPRGARRHLRRGHFGREGEARSLTQRAFSYREPTRVPGRLRSDRDSDRDREENTTPSGRCKRNSPGGLAPPPEGPGCPEASEGAEARRRAPAAGRLVCRRRQPALRDPPRLHRGGDRRPRGGVPALVAGAARRQGPENRLELDVEIMGATRKERP
jgi:hypothetical protein